MKLEIIKETDLKGEIMYHIEKDGTHVQDSFCVEKGRVLLLFDKIKNNNKKYPIVEIVKSETM